jgi:hypothetical protein
LLLRDVITQNTPKLSKRGPSSGCPLAASCHGLHLWRCFFDSDLRHTTIL